MAKLILSHKGKVIDQYFLKKTNITIGRDAGNDIAIDDPLLSREHARIVSVGDDEIIEDLQSSNGTQINGRPLTRQILQHLDIIALGSHQLRYQSSRTASDADLERTIMIKPLPRMAQSDADTDASILAVPVTRSAKTKWPRGSVVVLKSPLSHASGEIVLLNEVVTTFGIPGEQLIVLTRRAQGFVATHVEGTLFPIINGQNIGTTACALRDGDLIEAAGYQLKFKLEAATEHA